ncbi:hypothetical protein J2W35_001664 [Variovorax boronicumulans]|nr:hypothetical protein [Variovorax boronicumulans]
MHLLAFFGTEEGLKNFFQQRGRHARGSISHRDDESACLRIDLHIDFHDAARRAVLDGVADDVLERAIDQLAMHFNDKTSVSIGAHAATRGAGFEVGVFRDVVQQLDQIHPLQWRDRRTSLQAMQREQLLDQAILDVNKDSVGQSTTAGYAINTKHVQTEVLVENGGTVVIGGIFELSETNDESRIPVLGELPYVGVLFRSRTREVKKSELLIFITPKMITDRNAAR